MRVLTYTNPFKLKENDELWNILHNYPQFCASNTLVQGLNAEYGRAEFNILRGVAELEEAILGEFLTDSQVDMQLYIKVLDEIRKISDDNLKQAFKFNVQKVVKTIKMCLLLECDIDEFCFSILNNEQKIFVNIFKAVKNIPCLESLKKAQNITSDEFYSRVKSTLVGEIKYFLDVYPEYQEIAGDKGKIESVEDFAIAVDKLIEVLEYKANSAEDDFGKFVSKNYELKLLKYLWKLYKNFDITKKSPIVINGVHKFTPELMCTLNIAKRLDIEIIFVINYASNFKNLFSTWDRVYAWTNCEFEFKGPINPDDGGKLGYTYGNLFDGKVSNEKFENKIIAYSNITSFTDGEVRKKYKLALNKVDPQNALKSMKTQYYAVNCDESNKILKNYFPEQFKYKPFLAYPIGQFIHALYELWDFENRNMLIDLKMIQESIASEVYKSEFDLVDIFEKTNLYFEDIENYDEFVDRIEKLKEAIEIVEKNDEFKKLKYISFLDCSLIEIDELLKFVKFIKTISEKVFLASNAKIDFRMHFKRLMEVIEEEIDDANISKTEKILVNELIGRLSEINNSSGIEGNIQDVKDALYYFLSDRNQKDSSNWIVRGFEQLDGAVLNRKKKGRSSMATLHLAMVSNSNVIGSKNSAQYWPINDRMLNSYRSLNSSINILNICTKEFNNYYKYLLFYAIFFTKTKIEISYVKKESGIEQRPFNLLELIGLEEEEFSIVDKRFKNKYVKSKVSQTFEGNSITSESKEIFAICPYKFFQTEILKNHILYYSDYHIKYFVINFVSQKIELGENISEGVVNTNFKLLMNSMKNIFPFWNNSVFKDIEYKAKADLNNQKDYLSKHNWKSNSLDYNRRKLNFLIASWTEFKNEHGVGSGNKIDYMNFNTSKNKLEEYMCDTELLKQNQIPYEKICENCNCNNMCLAKYSYNYGMSEDNSDGQEE